jgi:hypothetical protein
MTSSSGLVVVVLFVLTITFSLISANVVVGNTNALSMDAYAKMRGTL